MQRRSLFTYLNETYSPRTTAATRSPRSPEPRGLKASEPGAELVLRQALRNVDLHRWTAERGMAEN